jgi:hypothetical protein
VLFKGSKSPGDTVPPGSGIYAAGYVNGALTDVFPVIEEGDPVANLDASAPAGSTVSSVGIEREAIRNGWVTLTMSSGTEEDGWAGIYATHVPALNDIPPTK